ncbi:MAG: hypothetical protein H5T69_11225, partial [Chloroflexi bacterium]|nr:hypothetical protein [Chloroflexota bacterium]
LARLGRAATLWAIPLLQGNRPLAVEGDIQYVLILDEDGDTIGTLVWQRSNARIWQPYSFDLAPYAGRAIRIRLGVFNDGLGRCTAGYVDDVTLQVCALP